MHGQPAARVRAFVQAALLLLALGALAAGAYQTGTGRWHATPVLSGSMRPGLQPGDVVVTKRVPVSSLQVRDVIVFHPPGEPDRLKVHRVVKLTAASGAISVTTRGDANSADDPEQATLSGPDTYRVERVIPLVGYPAVWLSSGNHGAMAIVLGVLLLGLAGATALRKDSSMAAAPEPAPDEDTGAPRRRPSALRT